MKTQYQVLEAGDVLTETKKWYHEHYPEMLESDMLYPSSEWLVYGEPAGWPGLMIFSIVIYHSVFYNKAVIIYYGCY